MLKKSKGFNFYKLAVLSLVCLVAASCHTIEEPVTGGTVTDIDGNVYQTVTIAGQTWMIDNLRTTRYNDGTAIPLVTDSASWSTLKTQGFCWYNNDEASAKAKNYGALYNWYAVDSYKLAPSGWHIPTADEWATLEANVSKYYYRSGSLSKILASTVGWETTTSSSTIGSDLTKNNSSGFNGIPGGMRADSTAFFKSGKEQGIWWCSNSYDTEKAWSWSLVYNLTTVERAAKSMESGFSVRCIKDSSR
jgi:uncharacterized protein (TIGR02145 family)